MNERKQKLLEFIYRFEDLESRILIKMLNNELSNRKDAPHPNEIDEL